MRVARVLSDGSARYAVVEGAEARLIEGAPYDGVTLSNAPPEEFAALSLLVPVEPTTVFAVGRNYAAHAQEMGTLVRDEPTVFLKPPGSLLPSGGTVVLPPTAVSQRVEHEAELAVVIGKRARNVNRDQALSYVFGYTCADDVSARDIQRADVTPTRAKGFDTFCPLGPWIETDVSTDALAIRCTVNGELRQDGNTNQLLFDVATIVSWISGWATLRPGDVILTGSPAGTGPLVAGDVVEIEVEGIGRLVHNVAAA